MQAHGKARSKNGRYITIPIATYFVSLAGRCSESRRARAREMFARVAGFPAIKSLDQYDFGFATGAPR